MFLKPLADVLNGKPCVGENRPLLIRNKQSGEKKTWKESDDSCQSFLMQDACGIYNLFIWCNQRIDLNFIWKDNLTHSTSCRDWYQCRNNAVCLVSTFFSVAATNFQIIPFTFPPPENGCTQPCTISTKPSGSGPNETSRSRIKNCGLKILCLWPDN